MLAYWRTSLQLRRSISMDCKYSPTYILTHESLWSRGYLHCMHNTCVLMEMSAQYSEIIIKKPKNANSRGISFSFRKSHIETHTQHIHISFRHIIHASSSINPMVDVHFVGHHGHSCMEVYSRYLRYL